MRSLIVALVILMLTLAPSAIAAGPPDAPPQLYLPARHFWQTQNNCGPTAVAMAASVFGIDVDPQITSVKVQARSTWVGSDVPVAHDVEKQIALELAR